MTNELLWYVLQYKLKQKYSKKLFYSINNNSKVTHCLFNLRPVTLGLNILLFLPDKVKRKHPVKCFLLSYV